MRKLEFQIVDVFATTRYAGNQLAVFPRASELSTDAMQDIARETNFSETTFVTGGSPEHGFDVRIFTPSRELPFAGHPTLGTASVLADDFELEGECEVRLHLGVGDVSVTRQGDDDQARYWFKAPPIRLGEEIAADKIMRISGLQQTDLDPAYPAQRVNVGPTFTFVPLASLESLGRCRLNPDEFNAIFPDSGMPEIYAFARGAIEPQHDITVRLFFDANGVREDPATGSAAACLGAYLVQHRYLGVSEADIRVEQGREINRLSSLAVQARPQGAGFAVRVGGRVIATAQGHFFQ